MCCAGLRSFWPLALLRKAPAAIILKASRRLSNIGCTPLQAGVAPQSAPPCLPHVTPKALPSAFIFFGAFFMRVLFALLTSLAIAPAAMAQAKPVTTASGLVYESIKDGAGESPKATDTVKVHYKGMFLDGKEFDSSYKRGEPTEFPLNRVIPCWTEGVQRMKPGGKAKLTCPASIAYGERGAGGVIPPNTTLNFEVELIAVKR